MSSKYFPVVTGLQVSANGPTGFTVSWAAPVPESAYPAPLGGYDVAVSAGSALGAVAARYQVTGTSVQVTGLHSGSLYTVGVRAQDVAGGHSAPWVTTGAATTGVSLSQVNAMTAFMVSQKGKPYGQDTSINPQTGKEYRFGPTEYDCSGLVYAAAQVAGVPLPQSQATAHVEAAWFAALPGATVVPDIPHLKAGDVVACLGSAPNDITINGHVYHIGHIGLMIDSTYLISALNSKEGVALANVNYMQAQLAVRAQA